MCHLNYLHKFVIDKRDLDNFLSGKFELLVFFLTFSQVYNYFAEFFLENLSKPLQILTILNSTPFCVHTKLTIYINGKKLNFLVAHLRLE